MNLESKYGIEMTNACYSWEVLQEKTGDKKQNNKMASELTEVPTLFNINFNLKRGGLTGVAGLVGSGKSSLMSSIMGEVYNFMFKVKV